MSAREEYIEQIKSGIALLKLWDKAEENADRIKALETELARLETPRNDQADFIALMGAFGGRK